MDKTNIQLISDFFFGKDMPTAKKMEELKQLTAQDKEQLGEGIRNGTLTY